MQPKEERYHESTKIVEKGQIPVKRLWFTKSGVANNLRSLLYAASIAVVSSPAAMAATVSLEATCSAPSCTGLGGSQLSLQFVVDSDTSLITNLALNLEDNGPRGNGVLDYNLANTPVSSSISGAFGLVFGYEISIDSSPFFADDLSASNRDFGILALSGTQLSTVHLRAGSPSFRPTTIDEFLLGFTENEDLLRVVGLIFLDPISGGGVGLDFAVTEISVSESTAPTPVPLPAGAFFLLSGLLGFRILRGGQFSASP